ncbi:hypothetical protein [Teichococcus aestuarii]|uniref:hypothetical protein n=1 Tax=Teichococcus aestuarii TaxID=568898 RepID=UPI003618D718
MFLPVMGAEARRRALAARAAGRGLFLARLALGVDAALEEQAGDWLRRKGEVLASHNPAGAEPPVLELLLASEEGLPALSEQAALLDPGCHVLREIAALPEAAPAAEAEAAGPVTLRVRQETVDDIIALQAELGAAVLSSPRWCGRAARAPRWAGWRGWNPRCRPMPRRASRPRWSGCARARRRWKPWRAASASSCAGWTRR